MNLSSSETLKEKVDIKIILRTSSELNHEMYCSICLLLKENDKVISATPCGHCFHHNCIKKALEDKKFCPLCRKPATEATLLKLFIDFEDPDDEQAGVIEELKEEQMACYDEIASLNREIMQMQDRLMKTRQRLIQVLFKNKYLIEEIVSHWCLAGRQQKRLEALIPELSKNSKLSDAFAAATANSTIEDDVPNKKVKKQNSSGGSSYC